MPMTAKSTPSSCIQACNTVIVSSRGRPQAKPITKVTSIRPLKITFKMGSGFSGRIVFLG